MTAPHNIDNPKEKKLNFYTNFLYQEDTHCLILTWLHQCPMLIKLVDKRKKTSDITGNIQKFNLVELKNNNSYALPIIMLAILNAKSQLDQASIASKVNMIKIVVDCNMGFPSENIFPPFLYDDLLLTLVQGYFPECQQKIRIFISGSNDIVNDAQKKCHHENDRAINKKDALKEILKKEESVSTLVPVTNSQVSHKSLLRDRSCSMESYMDKKGFFSTLRVRAVSQQAVLSVSEPHVTRLAVQL